MINRMRGRDTIAPHSGCCAGDFNGDVFVHGKTTTQILEIAGGDVAESFTIAHDTTIQPGTVVAIDPANPGQLRVADHAYDRTVAGIVAGANGMTRRHLIFGADI